MDAQKIIPVNLQLENYRISFIYGFMMDCKKIKDEFGNYKKKLEENSSKKKQTWITAFPVGRDINEQIRSIKLNDIDPIMIQPLSSKDYIQSFDGVTGDIEIRIERHFNLCDDGFGTLIIDIIPKTIGDECNVGTLLRILRLAPRLFNGENKEKLDPLLFRSESNPDFNTNNYSDIYKIFVDSMIFDIPDIFINPEIFEDPDEEKCPYWAYKSYRHTHTDIDYKTANDYIDFIHDAQIPYIYVYGTLPNTIYKELHTAKAPTDEISAILSRWMTKANIENVDNEFRDKDHFNDKRHLNQYFNKKFFTAFSPSVAISFRPESIGGKFPEFEEPIIISHDSILSAIEYSRMRLYQVMWMNTELNILIEDILGLQDRIPLAKLFTSLLKLQEILATHFSNPYTKLWDESVGSNIAEFLHEKFIDPIEKDIKEKFNYSRNLYYDKLKQDFIPEIIQD